MPGKTGVEATREIRQSPALQHVVIVATSASVFDKDRQQSMLAGCNTFLPKPIEVGKLLKLLETYLELEWIYDKKTVSAAIEAIATGQAEAKASEAEGPEAKGPLVPPPPEEMEILHDLAMRGNMRRLREQAAYIEQLDKKFIPFARKLDQLARAYEDEQILILVEQYMK